MKIQTDASFYDTEEVFQRSSAVKTYESCSWSYYCNYLLKIPQEDNLGALQGNVCHSFFECMLHERHKRHFQTIVNANSVCAVKSCEYLVRKLIRRNNLPQTDEVFKKIDDMILVGLKADFYVAGGTIVGNEYRFVIENEDPKYRIRGTIDKIALMDNEPVVQIDDFKSSKLKYSGEDKDSGVQALMYCLASRKLWPDRKPKLRFVFLQYPEDPIQYAEFSDETLRGFEHYLAKTQISFENFSEKDAYSNFAADHDYPPDGSFGGKLACGYGKYPGHASKHGKVYWNCPYKFAREYYVVKKDGKIIRSHLKRADIRLKAGETIGRMRYDGCPRHHDLIGPASCAETQKPPKPKKQKIKLDDF